MAPKTIEIIDSGDVNHAVLYKLLIQTKKGQIEVVARATDNLDVLSSLIQSKGEFVPDITGALRAYLFHTMLQLTNSTSYEPDSPYDLKQTPYPKQFNSQPLQPPY